MDFLRDVRGREDRGVAILAGFHGGYASLPLAPEGLVAAWVHAPNGRVHTSANGGWEYPVFLACASIAHFLVGDGRLAARGDAWLPTAWKGAPWMTPAAATTPRRR